MSGQLHYGRRMIKSHNDRLLSIMLNILNFNINFVILFLLGICSLVFESSQTAVGWHEENKELIYSLITGVGISGIICWFFVFRITPRGKIRFNLPYFLWLTCHLIAVATFLYFLMILGVRQDGSVSGLALGVFFGLILYSPFNILYNLLYGHKK